MVAPLMVPLTLTELPTVVLPFRVTLDVPMRLPAITLVLAPTALSVMVTESSTLPTALISLAPVPILNVAPLAEPVMLMDVPVVESSALKVAPSMVLIVCVPLPLSVIVPLAREAVRLFSPVPNSRPVVPARSRVDTVRVFSVPRSFQALVPLTSLAVMVFVEAASLFTVTLDRE